MKLRVSYTAGAGFVVNWPALLASSLGFYADEGLDVDLVPLSQAEQTAQLISGESPVERRGPDEDIVLIEQGQPLRIVAGLARKPPIWLYAVPEITTIEQLRGKTLAGVSSKFGSTLALRMVLNDAGLADDAYRVTAAGGTLRRYAALRSGEVAATLLSPPTSAQARAQGFSLLASLPERYPNFLYSSIQVNTAFARDHRATVVQLLRADIRAQQWIYDPANREKATALLADADMMTSADAEACYAETVEQHQIYCHAGEIGPLFLHDLIAGLQRLGEIGPRLKPEDYLDTSFLAEAREQLGFTASAS
jgi:ABC-type nitrate/sulfonate/bicarbonate transport system substrate-binding protein